VGMLVELVGLAMPKGVDVTPVLDEVVQRFRDELDYRKEARYQAAFSQLWKGQPGVAIPEVVASHSTGKVLTSTWAHGITLDEAALLPEEERRRYAERLWAFVFRGNLVGGAFNADPHPGNFLFGPDGLVTFLDFGCVQPLPEAARRAAIQAHRGAANRDRELFRSSIRALMQMPEGPFADAMTDYVELCFQPIFDAPFRISREFTRGLTEAGADSKKILFAKGGRPAAPPPYLAMMNRVQFGFYSVLARLNVEVDYRMVDNWVLDEAEALSSGLILDELKRA
jgi:predicted unusual protein kinase regulating ubiquinone biosynthesis (AarF/ABC1/UbiB family)